MGRLSVAVVFASLILAGLSIIFNIPYQVGIGIIAFAAIWALLALPRQGVLRRRWDSNPTKILSVEVLDHNFGLAGKNGFPQLLKRGP